MENFLADTSGVNAMHHDVVLTPDGRFIITAHRAVGIRVYDVTTVKLVSCIECPDVWNVLIANDGLTLVCTTHSKHIMVRIRLKSIYEGAAHYTLE